MSQSTNISADPQHIADTLKHSGFKGTIIPRTDLSYPSSRKIFNPRITTRPLLIAYANSPSDVQKVVALALSYPPSSKITVCARSGGHSYEGTCLGDEYTLVVDLTRLNDVRIEEVYDRTGRRLFVGGGTQMGCLMRRLLDYENGIWQIPTGLCPGVGMGGLATGM